MVVLHVGRGGRTMGQVGTEMTHTGQGSDNRTNKNANPHAPSARQARPFANGPTFPRWTPDRHGRQESKWQEGSEGWFGVVTTAENPRSDAARNEIFQILALSEALVAMGFPWLRHYWFRAYLN